MPILALDTATLVSSVALATGDTLLAELTLQTRKTHSERLMPHVEMILALAEADRQAIEAVAVSIGPGSFTGLRIGLATAKALAYARQVPLIGVPTLEALAFGCAAPGAILASTMDAQKGNIYLAVYRCQPEGLEEMLPPRMTGMAEAIAVLQGFDQSPLVLGEAVQLFQNDLRQAGLSLAEPHTAMPRAGSVAILGGKMLARGIRHDVMALEPFYIRRSEAEELWERRRSQQG